MDIWIHQKDTFMQKAVYHKLLLLISVSGGLSEF